MAKRKTYIFDSEGKFVGTTKNSKELADRLNVLGGDIANCLGNRRKTIRGYFFCQPLEEVSDKGLKQLEKLAVLWLTAQKKSFDGFVKSVTDVE